MKSLRLVLLLTLNFANAWSQNDCDPETFYSNACFFVTDTVYSDVLIDGQYFTVKVVSDLLDEYQQHYLEDDREFSACRTLIFYAKETGKIVFVKRAGATIPSFEKKAGKQLNREGKLYLNRVTSGGGSGYRMETGYVHLENGKIMVNELFESGEISAVFFNTNDSEILVFDGIWDVGAGESHFESHRCTVRKYTFENGMFHSKELGTTKNKYFNDVPSLEDLQQVINKEKLLPANTDSSKFHLYTW